MVGIKSLEKEIPKYKDYFGNIKDIKVKDGHLHFRCELFAITLVSGVIYFLHPNKRWGEDYYIFRSSDLIELLNSFYTEEEEW